MTATAIRYADLVVRKAASDGRGVFTALASTELRDRQDEVLELQAWKADAASFRSGVIPILIDHDVDREAGHVTDLRLERVGLLIEAKLDLDTPDGAKAYEAMLAGPDLPAVSVGFEALQSHVDTDGVRHITRAVLKEVSVLLSKSPALPVARVLSVKSEDADDAAILERLDRLEREHGITRKEKTPTDAELRARLDRLEAGSRSDDDIRRELERVERLVGLGHNGDGLGGRDGISSPDGVTVLG